MPVDVQTVFYRKIQRDEAFVISEVSSLVGDASYNVRLKNPEDSDKTIWVVDISVSSDGPYIANIHDGFSESPSGGSSVEIQSMLLDTERVNNNGVAIAEQGVSFTSNSTHAVGVGGGSGPSTNMAFGAGTSHAAMAIEPGREIVVDVENTSSSENNYGISIVYYEKND